MHSGYPQHVTEVGPVRPQRRTLRGVSAPFHVYAVQWPTGSGWTAVRGASVAGEPVRVDAVERRDGVRWGRAADGRKVALWGTTAKLWVVVS